ncbi:hypothetical protein [Streptomyces sp. NPDC051569]|uniref:hypothetical protein n=1 Tax=Streptomyces sp. NPDC051569 TaxID=3365661 RepID=UPI003792DBFC
MTSSLQRHARIAKLRSRRHSVGDEEVRAVLVDLDGSGLVEDVEALVKKWTGRKRNISVRGLLAGMFLASDHNRGTVVLTHVADLLAFALSDTMREELGVRRYPDNDRGFEAFYAVVRRLFKAILKEVDPSPLPKGRRLDLDVVAALLARRHPPYPRHRRSDDPAGLPARTRQQAETTELGRRHRPERRPPTPPAHPPPADQTPRDLDPHRLHPHSLNGPDSQT